MSLVLFWLLWGGVFLFATLDIAVRLATMTLFSMGRKPLLGIATFGILTAIGVGISLYVFLSTFALDSSGTASGRSIEIGAFAFLVVATVFALNVKRSGRAFAYVFRGYRATRLLRAKRFAEAQIRFGGMVAKYPGDAYAWYGQAQSLAGLHRYVEALVSTEQALAATTAKPTSVSWRLQMWLFKGGTLYSLHRNTEALSALDESLALNPNYSLAWAQKAYILQRDGYQEQALAAAERALNGNGILSGSIWRGMALIAKAGALNGIGRYMDGLDTAKQALPFAPQSSSIWIVQADALAHLGHPDEAQQAANQGLAKVEQQIADYSERWEYWENKAALLRLLGRMGEAETAEAQTQALIEKLTPPTT